MSAFEHPGYADQRFTASGGYILQQRAEAGEPMRLAVTAGQDDAGVALEEHEAIDIARWLLHEVLDPDDWQTVIDAFHSTTWWELDQRALQDEARGSIDR